MNAKGLAADDLHARPNPIDARPHFKSRYGATIEVRSAMDGSVVSVVSVPSNLGLVLPLGEFVGYMHHEGELKPR